MATRNIFQQLSKKIRVLQEENARLKQAPKKTYIKELFKMTILCQQQQKTIKEYEDSMNELLSQMEEAPKEVVGLFDEPQWDKVQALVRGFLCRKPQKCCVCYEPCIIKNQCCNNYLCNECRPRCNNKCPCCRTPFVRNNIYDELNMPQPQQQPLFGDSSDSESESEDEEEVVDIDLTLNPNPHMDIEVRSDYRYSEGENRAPEYGYFPRIIFVALRPNNVLLSNQVANAYRRLTHHRVPPSHRVSTSNPNQILFLLNKFRITRQNIVLSTDNRIHMGDREQIEQLLFNRYNRIYSNKFYDNIRDLSNDNCPRMFIGTNGLGEPYATQHIDSVYPYGSGRSLSSQFKRENPEYAGSTNEAVRKRFMYNIMRNARTITTDNFEDGNNRYKFFMLGSCISHQLDMFFVKL